MRHHISPSHHLVILWKSVVMHKQVTHLWECIHVIAGGTNSLPIHSSFFWSPMIVMRDEIQNCEEVKTHEICTTNIIWTQPIKNHFQWISLSWASASMSFVWQIYFEFFFISKSLCSGENGIAFRSIEYWSPYDWWWFFVTVCVDAIWFWAVNEMYEK